MVELEAHAREATGSDPETVRALSVAHEQAQALMGTLGSLGGKLPPKEFMAALRPMLEPLARVLAEGASPRGEASPEGAGKAT